MREVFSKCAVASDCTKCGNCSQDFPRAIKFWEGTKAVVVVIVSREGLFFWQPTQSLTTCLLTSCGAQVQTVFMEKRWEGREGSPRRLRTRAEDQVPVPGNQGRGSADCFTAPVFKNCFLLCIGVHPFLPISLEEKSSSRWGNECFGHLMAQEQWEKSKQSLSWFLDPRFHTWYSWLLWKISSGILCAFPLGALITWSKAGSNAGIQRSVGSLSKHSFSKNP